MIITSQIESGRKVRSTNADRASSFSTLASLSYAPYFGPWSAATFDGAGQLRSNDTGPETSGNKSGGLIWTGSLIGEIANLIKIKPYLIGANDTTMLMDAVGWEVADLGKATEIWTPVKLWEVTCTASTLTGLASKAILDTERFCDTIALTSLKGTQGTNIDVLSPADDSPGYLLFDARGYPIIEIRFHRNSSATSCNALWSRL